MPTTLPKRKPGEYRRKSACKASEASLLGATLFVALAFSVTTGALPAEFALPGISVIVVLSGLLVGGWALLIGRYRGLPIDRMLDIAGALVFFGFAAAIVSDKTEALRHLAVLPGI